MKNFKKLSRNDLKTVKAGERQTWFVETSCGVSAMTTQDWTYQQVDEWEAKLEAYYCPKPVYSGNDAIHLA
ncbi:hypothetical protein LNP04_02770 [Chryseobacterium sp. C-71]|jgi:hypothetical protein|uniref:bacteriocin-like protein n=1 Tax=Chryseobacterium sp. C-71 TaxID=2893882 RepID=UPI001E37C0BD|nr:hypothetical protein [Chryseobacterium sp. C-71]UFH32655.1 hypothetical protein LNP04_02770 [Chryseobacterium sp. C-71]